MATGDSRAFAAVDDRHARAAFSPAVHAVSEDIAGATALAVTREPLGNTDAPLVTPIVTLGL